MGKKIYCFECNKAFNDYDDILYDQDADNYIHDDCLKDYTRIFIVPVEYDDLPDEE